MTNEKEQKMEAGNEDIEMLKALIQKSFSEQRELITRLETALDAMTSFNGKQMLDSRDMRLQLKVCDRTLIRWRNSGKLPYFKLRYTSGLPMYTGSSVRNTGTKVRTSEITNP